MALAISTIEAECVSPGKACQQALWMKQALIDYDIRLNDVPIMCDNKGAIDLIVPADSSSSIPADYVSAGHVLVPADRDRICCLGYLSLKPVPSMKMVKRSEKLAKELFTKLWVGKRLKSIIISCLPNDVMKSVIKCKTAKEMWNDLLLAHEGPSDIKDTKITALRLKFKAFKSLEGEKVNGTFTSLTTLYGKYNYKEGLIDQIYESETQRFTIQASSSKALISNHQFKDIDSDVEEDQRTSNEFMVDLNAEYHERSRLTNQKRFYKRSGRVGSARKPLEKSKETCFACGKLGDFQKDCPSHKTSTPSYLSSNNSFNKSKPYTPSFNQTSSQNSRNHQKDYKGKYKGLKAEMTVLTKRINDTTKEKSKKGKKEKEKSEKGLIDELFDWDDESVSSDNEGSTKIREFIAIAEVEPLVGKADA
ncbi:retrovirus-related pol polyprotein from transposon TNT 1-94 [Tanacetum coccineum]|uniref:Retrovirus-related pol polyprotein from transposon TNT 1-94 n=1 Tax=Tanacetum coccineum TaxID=301880 RepID=A0ABQ4ZCS5_9ASTR